jgi:hypothetical protein
MSSPILGQNLKENTLVARCVGGAVFRRLLVQIKGKRFAKRCTHSAWVGPREGGSHARMRMGVVRPFASSWSSRPLRTFTSTLVI